MSNIYFLIYKIKYQPTVMFKYFLSKSVRKGPYPQSQWFHHVILIVRSSFPMFTSTMILQRNNIDCKFHKLDFVFMYKFIDIFVNKIVSYISKMSLRSWHWFFELSKIYTWYLKTFIPMSMHHVTTRSTWNLQHNFCKITTLRWNIFMHYITFLKYDLSKTC